MPLDPEAGYASATAIILCAALSLLCAGTLSVVLAQKKAAERELFRAQQLEAINTALLQVSAAVAAQEGDATLKKDVSVTVPGGTMTVAARAEYEGRKWPLDQRTEVDEALLAHDLKVGSASFAKRSLMGTGPGGQERGQAQGQDQGLDDCLRSLFSAYGHADPKSDLSHGVGLIASSGGHDGQVWRLRAVTGNRLEERRVRFLGDPKRLFAVLSQDDMALGAMPTCQDLIGTP